MYDKFINFYNNYIKNYINNNLFLVDSIKDFILITYNYYILNYEKISYELIILY